MHTKRDIAWDSLAAAALIAGLILIALTVGLPLDLRFLKTTIEARLSAVLGRPASVEGHIRFLLSTKPVFSITDIVIHSAGPESEAHAVRVKSLRVQSDIASGRPWPVDVTVATVLDVLRVSGTIDDPLHARGLDLHFNLTSRYHEPKTVATGSPAPEIYDHHIEGRVSDAGGHYRLDPITGSIAGNDFTGSLTIAKKAGRPRFEGTLAMASLDLRPSSHKARRREKAAGVRSSRAPLGQSLLSTIELELAVRLGSVSLAPAEIKDLSFIATLQHGQLGISPLQFAIRDMSFIGGVSVDVRDVVPEVRLALDMGNVNFAGLFKKLAIPENITAEAQRLHLEMSSRGDSLRALLDHSTISLVLEGGQLRLGDRRRGKVVPIRIGHAEARAPSDGPVTIDADAIINHTPVKLSLVSARPEQYTVPTERLPAKLHISAPGTTLDVAGAISLPLDRERLRFDVSLKGEQLASLAPLLQRTLPPLGPYAIDGQLCASGDHFTMDKVNARIGNSTVRGNLSLQTKGVRPRLNVDLRADYLRLDDFVAAEADSSLLTQRARSVVEKRESGTAAASSNAPQRADPFFTPAVLRKFDADVAVNVDELDTGADQIKNISIKAGLDNGRIEIAKLDVTFPGGRIATTAAVELSDEDLTAEITAQVDRFDYGIVARRIDPKSETAGWLNLDVALKSRARSFDKLLGAANGHFRFAVWPENLSTRLFDLWAVGLLRGVLSNLNLASDARLNCIVGYFNSTNGLMSSEIILLDTSRITVEGEGNLDFRAREIDLVLTPRSKTPDLLSNPVPMKVTGKFDDYKIRPAKGGVIGSVVRIFTNVIKIPYQRIVHGDLPTGSDIMCAPAVDH